jgi:anti-sigma-K factor RskA
MSDLHLQEEEATLYVLGGLTETGRAEFEVRLADSAELRALVRELEEGAVAAAMASPQRNVPPQVWERIEKVVTEEARPGLLDFRLWFGWLRNGWAVAAACLIGWLVYAIWTGADGLPGMASAPATLEVNVQTGGMPAESAQTETDRVVSQPRSAANAERRSLETGLLAMTRENGALRLQNAELARQVMNISQVLTQQQALLAESSRMKFFQLGSSLDGDMAGTNAIPSPELQRALFLAMARELGWLQSPGSLGAGSMQTNQGGVDFVDLRPGTNTMQAPIHVQSQIEPEPESTQESPLLASDSGNAIPGFVSNTNVVLAFQPSSVAPTGSELNFWTGDSIHGYQFLGSTVMGNNPMVVTLQPGNVNSEAMTFTVTAGNGSSFTVLGQFPATNPTPP